MAIPLFSHTKHTERCPQCGAPLQLRHGKKGLFWGCSSYPQCDYLKSVHQISEVRTLKILDEPCPECGEMLALKQGQFGMFIGCSDYPNCHFVAHEQAQSQAEESCPCPECGKGQLIARRGRMGKIFYGCDHFPHCKFTAPNLPYAMACPVCGGQFAILKKFNKTHRTFQCLNKHCRHIFERE